jgi:ribose-phosphate pyrophosphokinase
LLSDDRFKIFSGSANAPLAEAICRYLEVPLGHAEHGRFSDGESRFQILENVRGADVFVVQPCSQPVDFHLMQLLLMIDAFKRASAWRITAGDSLLRVRPAGPQRPPARADLREAGGGFAGNGRSASRADSGSSCAADSGLFQYSGGSLVRLARCWSNISRRRSSDRSPWFRRTRAASSAPGMFAKRMDAPLAIVDKRRIDVNVSEVMHLIGDVAGRPALVIDDIIDTAGTLVKNGRSAARQRRDQGLRRVRLTPILSGPAVDRIVNRRSRKLMVTDSVPLS